MRSFFLVLVLSAVSACDHQWGKSLIAEAFIAKGQVSFGRYVQHSDTACGEIDVPDDNGNHWGLRPFIANINADIQATVDLGPDASNRRSSYLRRADFLAAVRNCLVEEAP